MLVNALDPEELRVAILRGGCLDELYVETRSSGPAAGDIYKGRVSRYEPALEAAFVDIGTGKHGFLHVSDVALGDLKGRGPRAAQTPDRLSRARQLLQSGREILVQVKKEGVGNKGPALTTHLSLPGRHLVLMPSLGRIGVSKRITDPTLREALKETLASLRPLEGLGFVIRTEARCADPAELRKDADELLERWRALVALAASSPAPSLVHAEGDLVHRALRDFLTSDVSEIWIDSPVAYARAREFIARFAPAFRDACRLYDLPEPLFHHFGVEDEMRRRLGREVRLPSGGRIVIEQTEALVAIDVNSGRTRHRGSSSAMILRTNLEAAREIACQLRLRDLGGIVVIDFIDMDDPEDRLRVEEEFRKALEPDKARVTVLPISALGLLEMTRQRRRDTLERRTTEPCPRCAGRGVVRSLESLALGLLRELRSALSRCTGAPVVRLEVRVHPERLAPLEERLRGDLAALPAPVVLRADPQVPQDGFVVARPDSDDGAPRVPGAPPAP